MTRLALSLVLLGVLSACSEVPPPPYDLRFDESVSEAARELWRADAEAWNAVVGHAVFAEHSRECGHVILVQRPGGRGTSYRDKCNITIVYRDDDDRSMRLHELGHALMSGSDDDHRAGQTVMATDGARMLELVPEDGAEVRAYWGLD